MSFLDLFFPKYCVVCRKNGRYICPSCKGKIERVEYLICPICERISEDGRTHQKCFKEDSLDGFITYFVFAESVKTIIHRIKYRPYLSDLTQTLISLLPKQRDGFFKDFTVVPIPLHQTRLRKRGYNQSALLGKAFAKKESLAFASHILVRIKETKTQARLTQKERKENMRDAFQVDSKILPSHVLLLDDVWTTGSTLRSAAQVLKKNGVKVVWGVTIAK